MMKSTLLILSLVLGSMSSVAWGDTVAIEQLLYQGASQSEELNLSTEKTRTEYRDVRVPATCYRVEYRRQCTRRPSRCRRVCDRLGNCRRTCSPGGVICRNVAVRVPYRCTRIERRSYQVHDYYVQTKVKFQFNNSEVSDIVRENFTVRVTGERVKLEATGSNNYFLVLDTQLQSESMSNGVKYIDQIFKVSLVPANLAKSVLGDNITNVKLRNGVLNFHLGAGFNLSKFSQQIRIYQNRRLGSDPLLLNKFLTQHDMSVQSTASASIISVDLNSLGINIPAKMRVILDTKFKVDENKVLNKGQLKTSASANWIFR